MATAFDNMTALQARLDDLEARLAAGDDSLDYFFLTIMGSCVFLMQPGFAFLEAGAVRSKDTTNILLKNLLDCCVCALMWWGCGYGFAFGEPHNPFIGVADFLSITLEKKYYAKWFFQYTFAAASTTICSGAIAERCEFISYFIYCIIYSGIVYPVVVHWCWGNGWLADKAITLHGVVFVDFAGSGAVHLLAGSLSLVAAATIGARIGRFPKPGEAAKPPKGHSIPLAALGGFLLMFAFFAFNGGSQGQISHPGDGVAVAMAMKNTMIASASAGVSILFIHKYMPFLSKKWSFLQTINAALAGMVAMCSGCNNMEPWAAFVMGIGAGIFYLGFATAVAKMKIDDPLDTVGIHMGGGFWGLIFTPIIMNGGVVYGGENSGWTLLWNCIGAAAIISWAFLWGLIIFVPLKLAGLLRVPKEVELKGLDLFKHGEVAYPIDSYGDGWVTIEEANGRKLTMRLGNRPSLILSHPLETMVNGDNDILPSYVDVD